MRDLLIPLRLAGRASVGGRRRRAIIKDSVDDGTSIVIPSIYTRITIIASLAITVALGVFPAPVLDYIAQTASFIR